MNIKKSLASLALVATMVAGVGASAAYADTAPTTAAPSAASGARLTKACANLPQLKTLEGRMVANLQDRVSILTAIKADVQRPERQARIQTRIDKLNRRITKVGARLTKLEQKCATLPAG
jgi:peptidoglycan hydrolase CwlO-like protein